MSFKAEKASLPGGEFINLWGWYPPLPEKVWPELELRLLNAEGEDIAVSVNTMEARTEETAAGKSYYFNALWDGTKLEFGTFKTDVPEADMLDVVFNDDGTAEDLSPMKHTVAKVEFDYPFTVSYNETYKRNMVTFKPKANGQYHAPNTGSYYRIDYDKNGEFESKLADGHTFETLVKFDVDYSVPQNYETKFFSTHEQGGTGFLVANSSAASGGMV